MEDDVQSQPEVETGEVETLEQTTVTDDSGSEAAQTQSEDTDRGDVRVALKKEREEFRRKMNDPDYILQQARLLGLTEEEKATPQAPESPLTASEVRIQIRAEKAIEKYPELATNRKYQLMADALVRGGMDPVDAADEIFNLSKRDTEKVRVEAAQAAKAEIGEREKAQMVGNTVRTNPEAERLSEIQRNMKSPNKSTQEAATLEWLKAQNEKNGII